MSERSTHVDDLVLDYVYDELDAATRARVEAHLEGCEACRESVEAIAGTRRVMSSLPEAEPSRGPEAILQAAAREARLRGEKRRGLLARLGAYVAGHPFTTTATVAAVAMILVVGVDYGRESSMLTSAPPSTETRTAAAPADAPAAEKDMKQAKPATASKAVSPAKHEGFVEATPALQVKAAQADKLKAERAATIDGQAADDLAAAGEKTQAAEGRLAKKSKKGLGRVAHHARGPSAKPGEAAVDQRQAPAPERRAMKRRRAARVAPTPAPAHHASRATRTQRSLSDRDALDLEPRGAGAVGGGGATAASAPQRAAPPPPPRTKAAERFEPAKAPAEDETLMAGRAKKAPARARARHHERPAALRRAEARTEAKSSAPAAAGPAAAAAPTAAAPTVAPPPRPASTRTAAPATGGLGAATAGGSAGAASGASAKHAKGGSPSALAKARRLADAGHCDRATPILDTLLTRPSAPWQAEAYLYRCGCRAKAGRTDGARSDCAMVVALAPGSIYAKKARALLRSLDAFRNRSKPADSDVPIK